ncbi:hypothetical protein SESBI_40536 [Sesbania bispinosa]|nr:hypothetical protein SESBI_40536 [Sesbania bispinosa]
MEGDRCGGECGAAHPTTVRRVEVLEWLDRCPQRRTGRENRVDGVVVLQQCRG